MEHTGIKMSPELEKWIQTVIRVQLGAELTLTQLSALCFTDKMNWQHTGEFLRMSSLRKRIQAEKWIRFLGIRGGQFKIEQIETLVPVPHKEQLVNEQGKQLKVILELTMGVEKKVEEILRVLYREAKNAHEQVVCEIIESREIPKQIEMIRQLEAQLNTLFKAEVPEYLFEKLTIKPLVQHIKEKVHTKLTFRLNRVNVPQQGTMMIDNRLAREVNMIWPMNGKMF